MKTSVEEFYKELEGITNNIVAITNSKYTKLTNKQLNTKPAPDKWSIGECLQHLICYGNFYLAAMEEALANHKGSESKDSFKPGFFGNKFSEMLRYKEKGMKKMKSPNIESLTFATVELNVIEVFLKQQQQHLNILNRTKELNIEKVKVSIALTKLIKTKIGDTLRFTIYHNQRHIVQAEKVYESLFTVAVA